MTKVSAARIGQMNTTRIIRRLFLLVGLCGVGLTIYLVLSSAPSQPEPIYSPNHLRILIPTINTSKEDMTKYLCLKFKIIDAKTQQVLFEKQTGSSVRMRWSIQWLRDDYLLLDSSDIGVYCWQEGENGVWASADCP